MSESSTSHVHGAIRTGSALVEITCPAWCEVSPQAHASYIWDNEGRCVHRMVLEVQDPVGKQVWDEEPRHCPTIELVLCITTNPDGREVESADVLMNGHQSNFAHLARLTAAIADLEALYRATPGVR